MMPGVFLFRAARGLVESASMGPDAPAQLLTGTLTNLGTAFLIVLAMTLGLIVPRMLFERFRPSGLSHPMGGEPQRSPLA
jgi:hypothetical protein